MSGTLGKENNFKVQYKIPKSHRAHKTDCYSPLPCFYSTGFLTSQILLSIEDYCFSWNLYSFTVSGQNPEEKQNDIILSYLITSEDTQPINTLLSLRAWIYRDAAWRLTRAVGFVEKSPKAKLTPASFCFSEVLCAQIYSSFIHSTGYRDRTAKKLSEMYVTHSKEQLATPHQETLEILSSLNPPGSQLSWNPDCQKVSKKSWVPIKKRKSFSSQPQNL